MISESTLLPRRDAHAYNWLVTSGGHLLAVDLEATGWRPAGYELAQLTDDVPLLEVSKAGWSDRQTIVSTYLAELVEQGVDVDADQLRQNYEASLVARATRSLSDPSGNRKLRAHGEQLLEFISLHHELEAHRGFAKEMLEAWAHKRGVAVSHLASRPGDPRRRRVSRSLAFHLRHSKEVLTDPSGWASVELITSALNKSGLRTSEAEVASVASSIDARRFEVRAGRVRALYGHSVPVAITYSDSARLSSLFHATSVDSLNSIFQAIEGLRPMARQWVHLSSDWRAALVAGQRKRGPVLLRVTPDEDGLKHAGGTTWLSTEVPSHRISIVSLSEQCVLELREAGDISVVQALKN